MSLPSRMNHRKQQEFEKQFTKEKQEQEKEYARLFLEAHNKTRKKRDFVLLPWGARFRSLVFKQEEEGELNRPDYLLLECEDNSYFIRDIRPLEICTLKGPMAGNRFYIKAFKIEGFIDDITKKLTTKPTCFLCILGSEGNEQYYPLYTDGRLIKVMESRGKEKVPALGNKPAYYFKVDEVKWKPLRQPLPAIGRLL